MKNYANKKRVMKGFDIVEWVYVKLRPYRQQLIVHKIHPKLAPRYYDPFKILDRIGDVAYKLELPLNSRIHPVFHVSQLKKAVGSHVAEFKLPKELEIEAGSGD